MERFNKLSNETDSRNEFLPVSCSDVSISIFDACGVKRCEIVSHENKRLKRLGGTRTREEFADDKSPHSLHMYHSIICVFPSIPHHGMSKHEEIPYKCQVNRS